MWDKQELKKAMRDLLENAKGPNHEETVRILDQMKTQVVVNEELLKETKAGLAVGKLRQHQNATVSENAKELVKKWKTEVEAQKKEAAAKKAKAAQIAQRKASLQTKLSPQSPQPIATPATPTNLRTRIDDGVTIPTTGDKVRDSTLELIYNALASDSTAPSDLIVQRARKIESTVFDKHDGNSGGPYRQRMRSLYLNLKEKSNPSLRYAIVAGDLSIDKFCTMSVAEMASEERKREAARIEEENLFKAKGAAEQGAETDAFKCFRCGQRKTRYTQAQTRSADEPMTTFVTCVNCNNRWKFS